MTTPALDSGADATITSLDQPRAVVAIRRRTVDRLLIAVGAVAAVVFAVAGGLLTWGSNFADDYVGRELSSQQIFFPPEADLTSEGRTDLVKYADEQVTTGPEAQAYASFINGHLQGIAEGATYSELGATQAAARTAVTDAQDSGASADDVASLQTDLDAINAQRDSLFRGETLRGLLLSTYAWAKVGSIAFIAAIAAFVAAAVMAVLVAAGLFHIGRQHASATT